MSGLSEEVAFIVQRHRAHDWVDIPNPRCSSLDMARRRMAEYRGAFPYKCRIILRTITETVCASSDDGAVRS